MSVPLVVGMPVHRRHWILDDWFDSLEAQDPPGGTRLIFALSEEGDPSERVILRRWPSAEIIYCDGMPALGDEGRYDQRRHAVLAWIRNRLLRAVGAMGAEHYLSWDSDIILQEGALDALLAAQKDAVGALVDMGGHVAPGHWSWMDLDEDDWAYRTTTGPLPPPRNDRWSVGRVAAARVGVIMGVKLLSPRAVRSVRYTEHFLGEDIGFAVSAEKVGIDRWLCPAAMGEHVYRADSAEAPL